MRRKIVGIIIDDQRKYMDDLMKMFERIYHVEIAGCFEDEQDALIYMRTNPVDFIILDIELKKMTGFEFITLLTDKNIQIILYTAHHSYEDRGYDLRVADVLLKPVSESRLKGALRRLDSELEKLIPISEDSLEGHNSYFNIKAHIKYSRVIIWLKNIIYIESRDGKLKIYLVGESEPRISNQPFKEILEVLPSKWFKQCQQSFVFNINFYRGFSKKTVELTIRESQFATAPKQQGFNKKPDLSERITLPAGDRLVYKQFYNFVDSNTFGT
ncbi:response regulator transcription factor [Sphingobacterium alkalisoli]|uniref:Response regulator transcription factor n=1 Tax=Sphingobacterium alkalisoli TaxID=1874115 RepID=A0A4V5LYF5_9SPHI|nr:LytTR family DNA-binding domain-containing protein [Sphingobacterium alkalisoli]TJY65799.1 response regulator transcription factor [Sphingobacterium alkalisoli]GGH18245.1 hypothetical protein GCM10011418_21750 [Sphingobacterium alkalisoli]